MTTDRLGNVDRNARVRIEGRKATVLGPEGRKVVVLMADTGRTKRYAASAVAEMGWA